MQAVWMQEAALTTTAVKRSPLTAVVALPAVLEPGALPGSLSSGGSRSRGTTGGGPATVIGATMYNDGGEELEVGAWASGRGNHWYKSSCAAVAAKHGVAFCSPCLQWTLPCPHLLQVGDSLCNFLTLRATISTYPAPTAEVTLLFGKPGIQAAGAAGGSGNGPVGASCGPSGDPAAAAQHDGQFDWPELQAIDVLGWHLPALGMAVEVVARADDCGQLAVVQRLALPAQAVGARPGGGGLRLDLSSLRHRPECPHGLRLAWSAGSGAVLQAA